METFVHALRWLWMHLKRIGAPAWLLILGIGVAFAAAFRRERQRRLSAEQVADIEQARRTAEQARFAREALSKRADYHAAEIEKLDDEIAASERQILHNYDDTTGLDRDEIRRRLRRLGY
jgi:uncharacterized protein HemX